jgi:hypothetical protein
LTGSPIAYFGPLRLQKLVDLGDYEGGVSPEIDDARDLALVAARHDRLEHSFHPSAL